MSQEQQFLSPDQQDKLFQHLKDIGALSQDVGQNVQEPDAVAQNGTGNVDIATLQSLFKHAQNPDAVPMQEGDKMHPMDAMQQIMGQMGPSKPAWLNSTTGPQLTRDKNGQIYGNTNNESPIGKLFGLKSKVYASGQNFFDAAQKAGLTDGLDKSLPIGPDGKPWVNKSTFETLLTGKKAVQNPNNPPLSLSDALAMDVITQKTYDKLIDKGFKPEDERPATLWRLSTAGRMAGAREGLVSLGNNKMEQEMIQDLTSHISDSMAKGPVATQVNTLNQAVHGRQIVAGAYNPSTQQYDLKPQQLAELTMTMNRILTGSSNTAESAREEISAATAQGKFAKLAQYAGINDFNGTSQDLAKMYIQMLDRQGTTSNDIVNAQLSREVPRGILLKRLNPQAYNAVLEDSFGTHDYRQFLQSLPDAQQTVIPEQVNLGGRGHMPPPARKATGAWRVIR